MIRTSNRASHELKKKAVLTKILKTPSYYSTLQFEILLLVKDMMMIANQLIVSLLVVCEHHQRMIGECVLANPLCNGLQFALVYVRKKLITSHTLHRLP